MDWFEIKGKSFREEKAAKFAEKKGCKKKKEQKAHIFCIRKCQWPWPRNACLIRHVLSSWAVVNVKAQLFEKTRSPGEKCGGHRGFRESVEI